MRLDKVNQASLLLRGPFEQAGGFCWIAAGDGIPSGDTPDSPRRSPLVVLENGVQLGPIHARHDEIRAFGNGLCSHWNNAVFFSTSDNTDPNANGRTYALEVYSDPDVERPVVDAGREDLQTAVLKLFRKHNCVLIRNLIPLQRLELVLKAAHEVFEAQDQRARDDSFSSEQDRTAYLNGRFSDGELRTHTGGLMGAFEVVASERFVQVLNSIAGPTWAVSPITQIRRVSPKNQSEDAVWSVQTPFHIDSLYGPIDDRLVVVAWLPLTPYGDFGPKLEFVLAEPEAVRDHVTYRPDAPYEPDRYGRSGRFDRSSFEESRIHDRFREESFWAPTVRWGDVVLFTNWTLHRTYALPTMTKTRISLEVRFDTRV